MPCVNTPAAAGCTGSGWKSARCARWCRTRCSSASSWSPKAPRPRAPASTSTCAPRAGTCRGCGEDFVLADFDPALPVRQRRRRGDRRAGHPDPVHGSELTMCATCGCGDDAATVTVPGTPPDHQHPHHHHDPHPHPHPHTITSSRRCWPRTTTSPSSNRRRLARTRDRRVQSDEFARRREDHAAGADHPRARRPHRGRRHRGRSGDPARRRTDPRHRGAARCRSTPARAATSTPRWSATR